MLPRIKERMKYDSHAHSWDQGYFISSLYYDTPSLDCYRNKIDGCLHRRKYRIRSYGNATAVRTYLECKEKWNRVITKSRTELSPGAQDLLNTSLDLKSILHHLDPTPAVNQAMYWTYLGRLKPALVVTYHRIAFMGKNGENNMRVTFDKNLKYRSRHLNPATQEGGKHILAPDRVVMEVKFCEKIPSWMVYLLHNNTCNIIRISKYGLGMQRHLSQYNGHSRVTLG